MSALDNFEIEMTPPVSFGKIPLVTELKSRTSQQASHVLGSDHGIFSHSVPFGITDFERLAAGKVPLESIIGKLSHADELEAACHLLHESEFYYPAELLLRSTGQIEAADAYKKAVYQEIYGLQCLPDNVKQKDVEKLAEYRLKGVNPDNWESIIQQNLNILASYDPLILQHSERFEVANLEIPGPRIPKKSFHMFVGWVATRIQDNMNVFVHTTELEKNDEVAATYFSYLLTGRWYTAQKYLDGLMEKLFQGANVLAWPDDLFKARLKEWYKLNSNNPDSAKKVENYIENLRVLRMSDYYNHAETEAHSSVLIDSIRHMTRPRRRHSDNRNSR